MFTSTLSGDSSAQTLTLTGDLTLEHCREIHAELLRGIAAPVLHIDLSDTEKSDISFLQLLHALLRHADEAHVQVSFSTALPQHLLTLAAAAGDNSLVKDISARP